MPRIRRFRPGAMGVALALWDVWRRLPPKQRRQLMHLARQHGPTVAKHVAKRVGKTRGRRF